MKKTTLLILILLIGTLLRLFLIGNPAIRGDEVATIQAASVNWHDYVIMAKGDVHPPLFYRYLHLFTLIGTSEWILRLASALPGILCIIAIYFLGKAMYNERAGILSALIMAIAEYQIKYSQYLRMYTLLVLFTITTTYLFWRLLKKRRWTEQALFVLSGTLLIYTHYYGILIFLFQAIFLLIRDRKTLLRILPLYGVTAILFLPWFITFFSGQFIVKSAFEAAYTAHPITLSLFSLSSYNIFAQAALYIFHFIAGTIPAAANIPFILIALATFAILIICTLPLLKKMKPQTLFLLITLIGSIALILLVQYFRLITVLPYSRYLIFVTPHIYLLIAAGMTSYKQKTQSLLMITFILITGFSLFNYYHYDPLREDWKQAGRLVPEDTTYIYTATNALLLHYYYDGEIRFMPSQTKLTDELFFTRDILPEYGRTIRTCPENIPSHFIMVAFVQAHDQEFLDSCLFPYEKETLWTNTYKDIWGKQYEDIKIYYYTLPMDS